MPPSDPETCKFAAVKKAQSTHGSGRPSRSRKPEVLILVASAYVFGGGGLLAWMGFIVLGPRFSVALGLPAAGSLLIDGLLCLLFFTQHSFMVRRRFRVWLTRAVRSDFHGALYASASGGCLLLLVLFWQPVGTPFWEPKAAVYGAMLAVVMAALALGWWGSRALGDFDALGIKPAVAALDDRKQAGAVAFTVRGPYRWVRHPLYLVSLIVIWSGPVFTADRLLHNLLWSLWIAIGATLEEKDLVACFGDAYREYQRAVPMLIPRSLGPLVPELETPPHDRS